MRQQCIKTISLTRLERYAADQNITAETKEIKAIKQNKITKKKKKNNVSMQKKLIPVFYCCYCCTLKSVQKSVSGLY